MFDVCCHFISVSLGRNIYSFFTCGFLYYFQSCFIFISVHFSFVLLDDSNPDAQPPVVVLSGFILMFTASQREKCHVTHTEKAATRPAQTHTRRRWPFCVMPQKGPDRSLWQTVASKLTASLAVGVTIDDSVELRCNQWYI